MATEPAPQSPGGTKRRPPASASEHGQSPLTSAALQADDSQLPRGHCRYILTIPELKGYRCGCVSFSQNKAVPGAICECGHFACFHLASPSSASPGNSHDGIEMLKQRVQALEQQQSSAIDGQERLDQTVHRISQVEEVMERNQEEMRADFKSSYKHMSAAWNLVDQLQKRLSAYEDRQNAHSAQLEGTERELEDLRNRNLELLETDEMLEERIEQLEHPNSSCQPTGEEDRRSAASPDADIPAPRGSPGVSQKRPALAITNHLRCGASVPPPIPRIQLGVSEAPKPTGLVPLGVWTVHVSVLPSRDQPFPFEKDTAAYKRCLSRGLQRIVPVEGHSAEAITTAISKAFRSVLQNRAWEPLEAKVCDARRLEGLPMLRPLETEFSAKTCDVDVITDRCAVRDSCGRIQSMYVALRHVHLSWSTIRGLPVYMEGLESSWAFDKFLDQNERGDGDVGTDGHEARPRRASMSHATLVTTSLSLKRPSADVESVGGGGLSGALADGESDAPRAKVVRTCMPDALDFEARYESDLVSRN